MATTFAKILVRRDTAANWSAANPVLDNGEFGYSTDNHDLKFGDGVTPWNSLISYLTVLQGLAADAADSAADAAAVGASNDAIVEALVDNPVSLTRVALDALYAGSLGNVKNFGAVGDGVTDDSAAFQAAILAAKAARRSGTPSGSSDALGTYIITIPPGDYVITDPNALMGDEAPGSKAVGLRFIGSGLGITQLIFNPSTTGQVMCFNDYWLAVRFEKMSFIAKKADSTFMQSYTTHNAQDYTFMDCAWRGWKYAFDLQGNNNNSEFRILDCANHAMQADGAFLFIGATTTSDQFLNYWIDKFKHWSTAAPIIDATKGGHFHVSNIDISDFAPGETTTTRPIFALRGNTHAQGVCSFSAYVVRIEGKSVKTQLLYSEWPQGSVSFDQVDVSSQSGTYTYEDMIRVVYGNVNGPVYSFSDCTLAGGVNVSYAISAWSKQHKMVFSRCYWLQKLTPSEVVTWDESTASPNFTKPAVVFQNCRGTANNFPVASGGISVWDCVIGKEGETLVEMPKRTLKISASQGTLRTTDTYLLHLPLNAVITAFRAFAPAGATGSGTTGTTWTLNTTDGSPVVVAVITIPGALSAGFDVTTVKNPPFLCDTRARASLTVATTAAAVGIRQGFIVVEGYW